MKRAAHGDRDPAAKYWLHKSVDPVTDRLELCILGRLVLRLDPDPCHCAWYWRNNESGNLNRMSLQPNLLAPMSDPMVLALFGDWLLQRTDAYDRLQMPTMADCRRAMKSHLRENPELRDWQQEWHQALCGCQPGVLTYSEHACLDLRDGLPPALYSLVWRHEASFKDVSDNAPQLVPLLALVMASGSGLGSSHETLRNLRSLVCDLPACGAANWRWLLKWGLRPLRPFFRAFAGEDESRHGWRATARFLSLWSRAGLPAPLPEPVSQEWAARMMRLDELDSCCPERVAIVARHAACLSSAEVKDQACEMANVLDNSTKPLPLLDRNQKRAGWTWLRREFRDKRRAALVDGEALAHIRDRLPPMISISGFDLVPLKGVQAITEEGRLMDHCMGLTPSLYLRDGQLHFSVRRAGSGRRLATCSLSIGQQRPTLAEVRGPGNQPAPKSARRAANRLACHPKLIAALSETRCKQSPA